jgi:hypothetical protein
MPALVTYVEVSTAYCSMHCNGIPSAVVYCVNFETDLMSLADCAIATLRPSQRPVCEVHIRNYKS